jgi:hypothetical protein
MAHFGPPLVVREWDDTGEVYDSMEVGPDLSLMWGSLSSACWTIESLCGV